MLKPRSLCFCRSYLSAASVGAVCRPSGQKPWSRVPLWKTNDPLSTGRWTPFTFRTAIDRMPAYEPTRSAPALPESSAVTSYRNGSSGDHRRALGTGTENCWPTVPVAVPTCVPPLETVTLALAPSAPAARTVTRRVLSWRFGHHVEPGDARGGGRLQPDRLPDPGRGGVEDAAPGVRGHVLDALLADGLAAGLRGVVRGHDDRVAGAAVQQRRDVVREGVVAPSVDGPGLLAVDPDRGLPVGGTEVELDAAAAPAGRDGEGALVPELVVLGDLPLDTRERGLRCERHPDLLAERRRLTGVARRDREVPNAVEIGPVGAGELRSRILRQRVVDRDLVGPRRRHGCGLGGPGRRGGAGGGRAGGEEAGDGECQHRGGGRDAPPDRYGSQHGDRSSVSVAHGGTPPAGRWNWFNTRELAARLPQHSLVQLSRPIADNVVGRSMNSRLMAPR
jgi:hypothetical protein